MRVEEIKKEGDLLEEEETILKEEALVTESMSLTAKKDIQIEIDEDNNTSHEAEDIKKELVNGTENNVRNPLDLGSEGRSEGGISTDEGIVASDDEERKTIEIDPDNEKFSEGTGCYDDLSPELIGYGKGPTFPEDRRFANKKFKPRKKKTIIKKKPNNKNTVEDLSSVIHLGQLKKVDKQFENGEAKELNLAANLKEVQGILESAKIAVYGENTEVSVLQAYISKLKGESPTKLTSVDINDIGNMSETLLKHVDRNAKVLIEVQTLQENFKHFNSLMMKWPKLRVESLSWENKQYSKVNWRLGPWDKDDGQYLYGVPRDPWSLCSRGTSQDLSPHLLSQ
jgi:hypothetical protein